MPKQFVGLEQLGKETPTELSKSVHALARLLEQADYDQPEIIEVLSERGLPQLFRLYDRSLWRTISRLRIV